MMGVVLFCIGLSLITVSARETKLIHSKYQHPEWINQLSNPSGLYASPPNEVIDTRMRDSA
jgi:hypothetical protein